MTTQTIFQKFEMNKMEYLIKESEEVFKNKIKPIKFKDPDMSPEDNLSVSDNLNAGYFLIHFQISNGKYLLF
jgi:hypothetical protein